MRAKERRLQREVELEVARRLHADKVAAEADRRYQSAANLAAAKAERAALIARKNREFAESPAGKALGTFMLVGILGVIVFFIAFALGFSFSPWLVLSIVAIMFASLFALWKRGSLKLNVYGGSSLAALTSGLLLGAVGHDGSERSAAAAAVEARAHAVADAAQAHAKTAAQEHAHEQRLAWNKAHPREAAERRRRAQQQIATEEAHEARQRSATDRAWAAAHPSDDVIAARTKSAVGALDAMFPNNSVILQIRQDSNDPSRAIVMVDQAGYNEMSDFLRDATRKSIESKWAELYADKGLPGDAETHLAYQFTDYFDSH